jgi:hypothetical protein
LLTELPRGYDADTKTSHLIACPVARSTLVLAARSRRDDAAITSGESAFVKFRAATKMPKLSDAVTANDLPPRRNRRALRCSSGVGCAALAATKAAGP